MLLKTRGIVFRTVKYGDTSVIADIYTEEKGLQAFIIGGVRKAKSKFSPGLLQLSSLVELVAYYKVEKTLHRVKEMRPNHLYQEINSNVFKSSIGLFMIEAAQKGIMEAESNPPLFNFLWSCLTHLDERKTSLANFPLWYICQLTQFLGFRPYGYSSETIFFDQKEGKYSDVVPDHVYYLDEKNTQYLRGLLQLPIEEMHQLSIEKSDRTFLLEELLKYYRLHIEAFPELKSYRVLKTVLG